MRKAVIFGAGHVGGGYDGPLDSKVMSHAKAYKEHLDYELQGFYDKDIKKAQAMAGKWGTKAFLQKEEAFLAGDVFSICTPDETHSPFLEEALGYEPQGIILEKPMGISLKEATQIRDWAKGAKTKVLVNYPRVYQPFFIEIQKKIKQGQYGKLISGAGFYGKGLLHNGSHLISILNFLLGEVLQLKAVLSRQEEKKGIEDNYDFILTSAQGAKVYVTGISSSLFTIFEWSLLFEKGRLVFSEGGFYFREDVIHPDVRFEGYRILQEGEVQPTGYEHYMRHVLKALTKYLDGAEDAMAMVQENYLMMKVIQDIKECIL